MSDNQNMFEASEQELIGIAVRQLSSLCDNAKSRDGIGFNKSDSYIGHHLASLPEESWTDVDYTYCWCILFKYREQLESIFGTSIMSLYLSKLKTKNGTKIQEYLSNIQKLIKDNVNKKNIVNYSKSKRRFTLREYSALSNDNVKSVMKNINAEVEYKETCVVWTIDERYSQALNYIIDKYLGRPNVMFINSSEEAFHVLHNSSFDIEELINQGIDDRDTITILDDESKLNIKVASSSSYAKASKLSHYRYSEEDYCAYATVIFPKDIYIIKYLLLKSKYIIKLNGRRLSFSQARELFERNSIEHKISTSALGSCLIISDPLSHLCESDFSSVGVEPTIEGKVIKIHVETLGTLKSLMRHLRKYRVSISHDSIREITNSIRSIKNNYSQERHEKEQRNKSVNSYNYKDNHKSKARKSYTLSETMNSYELHIDYNPEFAPKLKEMVPDTYRTYRKEDATWIIRKPFNLTDVISFIETTLKHTRN